MLSGIRVKAILIAIFAFYVAPVLPLIALTSIPNFFGYDPTRDGTSLPVSLLVTAVWFLSIAPVCAAYFAAKLARQQPLLHGLVVGIAGGLLIYFMVYSTDAFFKAILIVVVILCGLFGGWLWRYRNTEREQEV